MKLEAGGGEGGVGMISGWVLTTEIGEISESDPAQSAFSEASDACFTLLSTSLWPQKCVIDLPTGEGL